MDSEWGTSRVAINTEERDGKPELKSLPDGQADTQGDGIPRTFFGSVDLCLENPLRVQGRAPRREFWYFMLFALILQTLVALLIASLEVTFHVNLGPVLTLVGVFLMTPILTATARRFHDIDMSGLWSLGTIIPVIGLALLLVLVKRGTQGPNRFGPENGIVGTKSA